MVPYQIGDGPYDGDGKEGDKGHTIVEHLGEAQHDGHPPNEIVGDKDEPAQDARLGRITTRVFPKPCEPHGRVLLDDNSVEHPKDDHPEKASPV